MHPHMHIFPYSEAFLKDLKITETGESVQTSLIQQFLVHPECHDIHPERYRKICPSDMHISFRYSCRKFAAVSSVITVSSNGRRNPLCLNSDIISSFTVIRSTESSPDVRRVAIWPGDCPHWPDIFQYGSLFQDLFPPG